MTSVLVVYDAHACVGKCDAKCHTAQDTLCDCICGGRYHGLGRRRAIEAARAGSRIRRADVERFATAHGFDPGELQVYDALKTPTAQIRRLRALERRRQKRAAWERWRQGERDLMGRRLEDWIGKDPGDG